MLTPVQNSSFLNLPDNALLQIVGDARGMLAYKEETFITSSLHQNKCALL